jgi:hypothetical protein
VHIRVSAETPDPAKLKFIPKMELPKILHEFAECTLSRFLRR